MFVLHTAIMLCTLANAQLPTAKKVQVPQNVQHASWVPYLQNSFALSEQDFRKLGLEALTQEQESSLFLWILDREQDAKDSVPRQDYSCGRPGTAFLQTFPDEYGKVTVLVRANGSAEEIISGVRERLRTMNSIEVVYSRGEADLIVDLVAMKTTNTAGYETGVAISTAVSQPCEWKVAANTSEYDALQDQFLQVGSDMKEVVNSIVASVDTNDLENQRKMNSGYRKYLLEHSKK